MKLHQVFLNNFGLFAGDNILDFSAGERDSGPKNITLIAGMNGAGKTTFLEAVQLALYGKTALGTRVSQNEYLEHLKSRIHRDRSGGFLSDEASVGLDFEHESMGSADRYRIVRKWALQGDRVEEALEVFRDGEVLTDVDQQFWQDFVRELVPPGVSQLFFFDGEKIQRLADDEDNESVAEAIKSLLGLDLVERLQDDLDIYRDRQLKKSGSKSALRDLDDAKSRLEQLRASLVHKNDLRAGLHLQRGPRQELKRLPYPGKDLQRSR